MSIVTVQQRQSVAFMTQEQRHVQVNAGSMVGSYYALDHGDEDRPKSEHQHLRFSFATADDLGDVYVYLSLLTLRTLWPLEGETVRHDPKFFHYSEAGVRNVELDGSALPPLRVKRPDGMIERHFSGPIRAGLDCRRKKWGLEARLNIHSGDPFDLNLAYKIPLERLLWRPCAVFTDDNIIGEAADHVFFRKTEPLSEYDRRRGLCPGPIHVSSSPTS